MVYLWPILLILGVFAGIVVVAFFGVGAVLLNLFDRAMAVIAFWRRKSKKEPNRRDNDRFTGW